MDDRVFPLHDTYGVPIEYIAEEVDHAGLAINWIEWMRDAVRAGWKYEKIRETIWRVNDGLYGKVWRDRAHFIPSLYLIMMDEK